MAPHPDDAPGDTLCPAGDSQVVLVSTDGEIPSWADHGAQAFISPKYFFLKAGRLRRCPRCGAAGAVTGTGGQERDPSLTGGVCGGC